MSNYREGMKAKKSSGPISNDMEKLNKDYKHAMDLLQDSDVDKNALEHSMNLLTEDSKNLYHDLQDSDKQQHVEHSSHNSGPHHTGSHHNSGPHHNSGTHQTGSEHINHPSSHSGHHARSDNGYKSKNDFHHPKKHHKISHSKVPGSYGPDSEFSNDHKDDYILKSQIVPPVCPACPQSSSCPREKPCPPCAPCARCPEPSFECKKVPNYNSSAVSNYLPNPMAAQGNIGDPSLASTGMSGNSNNLPKPMLNDFSKF